MNQVRTENNNTHTPPLPKQQIKAPYLENKEIQLRVGKVSKVARLMTKSRLKGALNLIILTHNAQMQLVQFTNWSV